MLSPSQRTKAVIAVSALTAAAFIILSGAPAAIDLTASASAASDGGPIGADLSSLRWAGIAGKPALDRPALQDPGPLQGTSPLTVGPVGLATTWNGAAAAALADIQAAGLLDQASAVSPVWQPELVGIPGGTRFAAAASSSDSAVADGAPVAIVTPVDAGTPDNGLPPVVSYPPTARASGS